MSEGISGFYDTESEVVTLRMSKETYLKLVAATTDKYNAQTDLRCAIKDDFKALYGEALAASYPMPEEAGVVAHADAEEIVQSPLWKALEPLAKFYKAEIEVLGNLQIAYVAWKKHRNGSFHLSVDTLMSAFTWDHSPQGATFWSEWDSKLRPEEVVKNSPLFEALKDKLRELGRGEEFVEAMASVLPHAEKCSLELDRDNLDSAMTWDKTPQGHEYWRAFHEALEE